MKKNYGLLAGILGGLLITGAVIFYGHYTAFADRTPVTTGGVTTNTVNNFTVLQKFSGNASSTQESTGTLYAGQTGTTTITAAGSVGVGTSTPSDALTLDRKNGIASSSIDVYPYTPATSTAQTIDCHDSNTIHIAMGTSATTFTLAPMVAGKSCTVIVSNPAAAAGALTWVAATGQPLYWVGGTLPTQTTTANKRDVWSFKADILGSTATSTPGVSILGAQSANF